MENPPDKIVIKKATNRRLAKKRVQWLNEHSTSYQILCWVDSLVLRYPLLRQAPKSFGQAKKDTPTSTNNMKRFIIFGFMIIFATISLKSSRVITNFDIARWYLDSDIVLICGTYKIDTLFLSHHDFNTPDSMRLTYDMIREIYHIDIDSVIKSCYIKDVLIDSIYSQDFSINYAKTKQGEDDYIYKLNELGDTVGVDTFKTMTGYFDDYSDNSYFRLENNKKHLVILSLTQHGYMIDYETEVSDWILELIAEVKNKGQAYIDDFFKKD